MPIRSPLGALGALMVLLQGIAAAALVPLETQPELQRLMVWMMIGVTCAITSVVVIVVLWFAFRNPGLLFSPRDISPEAHLYLYGPGSRVPQARPPIREGVVTLEVQEFFHEDSDEERKEQEEL